MPESQIEAILAQHDKRLGVVEQQIADLRSEIGLLRTEIRTEFGQVRGEIGQVRGEIGQLREEMGELRRELYAELRRLDAKIDLVATGIRGEIHSSFRMLQFTMVGLFGVAVPVWMWMLSYILKNL